MFGTLKITFQNRLKDMRVLSLICSCIFVPWVRATEIKSSLSQFRPNLWIMMEPSAVSCFPRGLISLNTSISYLIEPLPASGDAQQHAVFRAESLNLLGGSCLHHHGNKEHEEGLFDFITGMTSPQSRRVRRFFCGFFTKCHLIFCIKLLLICRKNGTWVRIWSMSSCC